MQVEQKLLENVDSKLNGQNALKAALLVSVWCLPILTAWYWVYHNAGSAVPIFLFASGALIGLAVRIHGKGFTPLFSLLAFLAHLLIVLGAFSLGLVLGEGQTLSAVILLGLYLAGAWTASFLGRHQVPFLEQRAYFKLAESTQHPSSLDLKNRWFVAIPTMGIACVISLFVGVFGLYSLDEYTRFVEPIVAEQEARQTLDNRAIDVSPSTLEKLSSEKALRHVYAFTTGEYINSRGYFVNRYPRSVYKAQTILKFLVENRQHTRAKFLLGLLTYKNNGPELIQEAADEGDLYAKIHIAAQFACYGKPDMARDLLNRLHRTTKEKYPRARIKRILAIGFAPVCDETREYPMSVEFVLY